MAKSDADISQREVERRRDDVLRVMLRTPPKPQSEMKIGKRKPSRSKSPQARKRRAQAKK
jgi:hypothetical protein